MSYLDRVDIDRPKRMLALDGGGIRGTLTLEILSEIEGMLRRELHRDESFVLADYFDYIAGTSSGAVIAAGLASGFSVAELQVLYETRGAEMFAKARFSKKFKYKYDSARLKALLQETYGAQTTLGDPRLQTLLMMVLRNATTDSPWPLSNNPHAKYNHPDRPDNNLLLPLWQLVRASTAAPTYFPPEVVTVGDTNFTFVDGGMTMYLNPAFQLFLMATLDAYGLGWRAEEKELLLVSVGSGTNPHANDALDPNQMNLYFNAYSIPAALMYASLIQQDMLCRVFGRCVHAPAIDGELGDIRAAKGILDRRLFTYVRYNVELSTAGLAALGLADVRPEDVQLMDSIDHIGDLQRVGKRAAEQVRPEHFQDFRDVKGMPTASVRPLGSPMAPGPWRPDSPLHPR